MNMFLQQQTSASTNVLYVRPGVRELPERYHELLGERPDALLHFEVLLVPHQNVGLHSVPRDVIRHQGPFSHRYSLRVMPEVTQGHPSIKEKDHA